MDENILVVDDEPQMLIAINETLRRKGYAVTTAGSVMEALCRLKERYYHLVLTDMRMPEMSGMDLLKKIKSLSPQTPVVLLTAYGTIQNAVDAMRHGAFDYLLKPFSSEALERVVRRALDSNPQRNEKPAHTIITQDPAFSHTLELAGQVAASEATVLIEAESGTGKELLARMLHQKSDRSKNDFIAVNCAALPENLLESELFGFEKGAFTGAVSSKPGKFELANGGTLLLDEIGEMAPILQAKLLRVLQEKEFLPVGSTTVKKVDVRLIFATNKNLKKLVEQGNFREDLYYRLNVFPVKLPALRERKEDIPELAKHFLKKYCSIMKKDIPEVKIEAMEMLQNYHWPGNIRELEHTIERLTIIVEEQAIEPSHISAVLFRTDTAGKSSIPKNIYELNDLKKQIRETSIFEIEKMFVIEALIRNNWNISRASKEVSMQRSNFQALIKKYGIHKPDSNTK